MPSFSYQFYETMFENKQSLINSFTFWTAPESIYSFIKMDQFMIFQKYKVGIICSVNTKKIMVYSYISYDFTFKWN